MLVQVEFKWQLFGKLHSLMSRQIQYLEETKTKLLKDNLKCFKELG